MPDQCGRHRQGPCPAGGDGRKFGEVAVSPGYLNKGQVEELPGRQKENHLFFGKALVQPGLITEQQLMENLKAFNQLKHHQKR